MAASTHDWNCPDVTLLALLARCEHVHSNGGHEQSTAEPGKKNQMNAIKNQVREIVTQYRYFYHVCYRFYKNTNRIAGMCDPAIQNYFGLYLFCKLSSVNTHTHTHICTVYFGNSYSLMHVSLKMSDKEYHGILLIFSCVLTF